MKQQGQQQNLVGDLGRPQNYVCVRQDLDVPLNVWIFVVVVILVFEGLRVVAVG